MSVTAAEGFVAGGVACGLKADGRLDLAVVATEEPEPAVAAGVFTSNLACAAPVEVSRRHLAATGGRARAVVLNSGNANAATGEQGRADAVEMAARVAEALPGRAGAAEVLVCSTGLIGFRLPMAAVRQGIAAVVPAAGRDGDGAAAEAILTTDTRPKQVAVDGAGFTVGGMAKGAAMLAPDMATMLAILTTDAAVEAHELRQALAGAVQGSFNALTVDGCTSTNDTVVVLASGRRARVDQSDLAAALGRACADLAALMADDAEGATKVARIMVTGAASDDEARAAARKVAESQLVKCSLYGRDPYWGRVVSELGSAKVGFDPDRVTVAYGGVVVCRGGQAAEHDQAAVRAHMAQRHIEVAADLGIGEGSGAVLTNDLTHAYVDENMGTS